jgi:hypothetical protein
MMLNTQTKLKYATESGREPSMNFESLNPATGELLGTYPEQDKAEIEVSMTSPVPIPGHRSEASRLQGMGANLALLAHWNLPTRK